MKRLTPAFLHHPLAREIALVLAIKLVVIAAIFYAFFDGRAVTTDPDTVADRIANPQRPLPALNPRSAHAD